MRRQPQARATKQQARINRFTTWKRKFQVVLLNRLDHELRNQSDWGESYRVSGCFPLPMKTSLFCKILISWCRPKIVDRWGQRCGKINPTQPDCRQILIRQQDWSCDWKPFRIACFSPKLRAWIESKQVINCLREVRRSPRPAVVLHSIAGAGAIPLPTFQRMERWSCLVEEKTSLSPQIALGEAKCSSLGRTNILATSTVLENFLQGSVQFWLLVTTAISWIR